MREILARFREYLAPARLWRVTRRPYRRAYLQKMTAGDEATGVDRMWGWRDFQAVFDEILRLQDYWARLYLFNLGRSMLRARAPKSFRLPWQNAPA